MLFSSGGRPETGKNGWKTDGKPFRLTFRGDRDGCAAKRRAKFFLELGLNKARKTAAGDRASLVAHASAACRKTRISGALAASWRERMEIMAAALCAHAPKGPIMGNGPAVGG
jgi:hypothetical protein